MGPPTHTTYDDAKLVLKVLLEAGHGAMFAGGCVRDRLLGLTPKDYDIATSARPFQVNDLFKSKHMRVIPTGIDHGTVTIVTRSGPVEITTLRRDVKTDGRHAVVEFDHATFETDAARRDFTINAMFEDDAGQIHDFAGGMHDIKDRVLRFVGTPEARIREDYLRILRYFRFWARLGFAPDERALTAIKNESKGLSQLSAERVTSEIWGIFAAPLCADAVAAMAQYKILPIVIPQSCRLDHRTMVMLRDCVNLPQDARPWTILALLLGLGQDVDWSEAKTFEFARGRRFSEKDAQTLAAIFSGWKALPALSRSTSDALDFAEWVEQKNPVRTLTEFYTAIWSFFAQHFNDIPRLEVIGWLLAMEKSFGYRRHTAPLVTGRDVLDADPTINGKAVGEILNNLRVSFRNGEWQTRPDGLEKMRNLLHSSRS